MLNLQGTHKIRHFFVRDLSQKFRNHANKTLLEPYNSLKKLKVMQIKHFYTDKTWIARKCFIRLISILLRDRMVQNMSCTHDFEIQNNLSQAKCLILWANRTFFLNLIVLETLPLNWPNNFSATKLYGAWHIHVYLYPV